MNSDSMDEGDLIAGTLRGDSEAFGQLVRRYQDRLYTNMVHILGNEEDARDVVHACDFVLAAGHRCVIAGVGVNVANFGEQGRSFLGEVLFGDTLRVSAYERGRLEI